MMMVHNYCIHVKNLFVNDLSFISDRTFSNMFLAIYSKTEKSIVNILRIILFYLQYNNSPHLPTVSNKQQLLKIPYAKYLIIITLYHRTSLNFI